MISLLLISTIALSILGIITAIIWRRVNFVWLENIATWIVWLLPFERIPSLNIGGVHSGFTVRFSQLMTLAGLWVLLLLLLKKDARLMKHSLNPLFFWLLGFVVLSLPSWYQIESFTRFATSIVAVLITFGAAFLVSNFITDIYTRIKQLMLIIAGACVFGWYQVIGDFIGLPMSLTFLDIQYTKVVFGIARLQGTAIEPLYFAGMLFLPIIACLLMIVRKQKILPNGPWVVSSPVALLGVFIISLLLTLSKAAMVIAAVIGVVVIVYAGTKTSIEKFIKLGISVSMLTVMLALGAFSLSSTFRKVVVGFGDNFVQTVKGNSPSSVERGIFLKTAFDLLPDKSISGIGPGQYGVQAWNRIWFVEKSQFLVVNNVYVEVWLEYGLLAAACFVLMLLMLLIKGLYLSSKLTFNEDATYLTLPILSFAMLAYVLQWMTFSPIYIMPIFIIIGLLSHIVFPTKK
jgi:O-antigen ligase